MCRKYDPKEEIPSPRQVQECHGLHSYGCEGLRLWEAAEQLLAAPGLHPALPAQQSQLSSILRPALSLAASI